MHKLQYKANYIYLMKENSFLRHRVHQLALRLATHDHIILGYFQGPKTKETLLP
jgi:hypothetical protein